MEVRAHEVDERGDGDAPENQCREQQQARQDEPCTRRTSLARDPHEPTIARSGSVHRLCTGQAADLTRTCLLMRLNIATMPRSLSGETASASPKPVSYTHLTLPTN